MADQYHIPVLLNPSIEGLDVKPSGIYVDLTFGGGGHGKAILEQLGDKGCLIGFDQDADAWANAPDDNRFILVKHNFRFLQHFLDYLDIEKVDGILADLGVSSHHFDVAERGFSFRFDGDLDMRMSSGLKLTAARVLNEYPAEKLFSVFKKYGEVASAGKLVKSVLSFRESNRFESTGQLRELGKSIAPRHDENKFLARVFQALRIEVNNEMGALREVLMQMPEVLRPGGRMVVIAYHSLEDRLVKNFIRSGSLDKSQADSDIYGHRDVPFRPVTRKAVQPGEEEVQQNPRARSAKLRIAQRL